MERLLETEGTCHIELDGGPDPPTMRERKSGEKLPIVKLLAFNVARPITLPLVKISSQRLIYVSGD